MSQTTNSIDERLRICLPRFPSELRRDLRLADLGMDSMDTVEFLCAVHEEFGVRLSEAEFHPEQTIGGLLGIIEQKVIPSAQL